MRGQVAGERGDLVQVAVEAGLRLLEHGHQRVAGLLAHRGPAALALVLVEPLVGQVERVLGVGRLVGHQHHAEGARDVEAPAGVAQGLVRGGGQRRQLLALAAGHDAELVAAEAVAAAPVRHGVREVAAEARQQRVADRMAEAVVVGLEAVEVEHDQRAGALGVGARDQLVQVNEQAAAVRQPREGVGERLAPRALEQVQVLAVGERHPHDHRAEGGHGERHRGSVDGGDRLVGEHAERGEREQRRQRHHPVALDPQRAGRRRRAPRGGADHQRRRGPQRRYERAVHAAAGRVHVHEEAVDDGRGREPGPEQRPGGARAPPGDREHRHHAAQQQEVRQQIGEVDGHHRAAAR